VSKRSKEKKPAPLADWEVTLDRPGHAPQVIPASRWKRAGKKGCFFYTFRDEQGVVAEFAPAWVQSVVRKEPPVVVHPPGRAAETGDEAEVLHAEHHPGTFVPSLDSCPEHDRADYEARVRALAAEAARTELAAKQQNGERG
jgi:hypothetical protein